MNSIYQVLKSLPKNINFIENVEIEARFRNFSKEDYQTLKDYLDKNFKPVKIETIDYITEDMRITQDGDKFFETTKGGSLFLKILNVAGVETKINVAEEKKEDLDIEEVDVFDLKRTKKRTSYQDGNISIDLTEVLENEEKKYEIELEVINPVNFSPKEFGDKIIKYAKELKRDSEDVISFVNNVIAGNSKTTLEYRFISKPRDLLKRDVTTPNSILSNYTVSIKADGEQYFLVFIEAGTWLVSLKSTKKISQQNYGLTGSVFPGELIKTENLIGKKVNFESVFLPFDCLSILGEVIKSESYLKRIKNLSKIHNLEIKDKLVKKIIVLEKKIFSLGTESNTFYSSFRKCFETKKELFYKEDGYIFTPVDSPYLTKGQEIGIKRERVLSKNPDVCKFKIMEKRSIDFFVKNSELFVEMKQTLVKFEKKINFTLQFSQSLEGKIVEFFPKFEEKQILMIPERIREDKKYPNNLQVALEIYYSYLEINPITEKTLLGEDTTLLREFNNYWIKGKLIGSLEGYVIDIGSGKGGDLAKYLKNSKIKKILAIEPNKEFSEEFQSRLKNYQGKEKVELLSGVGGEDSEKILEGLKKISPATYKNETLTVTFMISLTFFWRSKEMLKSLAKTLKEIHQFYKKLGGNDKIRVVYYTIDGYKVESFFEKLGKNKVTLNTIELEFNGKNQVFVDIKDSKTVSKQVEYLAKVNQLVELVDGKEIYKREPRAVNILMSEGEKEYLNLHTYGMFSLGEKQRKIQPLERLKISETSGVEIEKKFWLKEMINLKI